MWWLITVVSAGIDLMYMTYLAVQMELKLIKALQQVHDTALGVQLL